MTLLRALFDPDVLMSGLAMVRDIPRALMFLHTDPRLALIEYHRRWLEDRTGAPMHTPTPVLEPQPMFAPETKTVAAAAQEWLELGTAHRNAKGKIHGTQPRDEVLGGVPRCGLA